jgi:hypothetical protein
MKWHGKQFSFCSTIYIKETLRSFYETTHAVLCEKYLWRSLLRLVSRRLSRWLLVKIGLRWKLSLPKF